MTSTALKIVWFGTFAVVIFLFIVYSVFLPLFGDETQQAWQWLLPNLLPPFGLAVGLAIAEKPKAGAAVEGNALAAPAPTNPGDRAGAGKLALGMSLIYIAALLVSVLGVLFKADPIGFLNMTNFWLAPLLGLTTAALGAGMAKAA